MIHGFNKYKGDVNMKNKIEDQHVLTVIDQSEISEEIDIEKILEKITLEYLLENVNRTKKGKIIIFHNPTNSNPGRYWDNWYHRPLFEEYLQKYPDSEIFLGWKFTDRFKHNVDSRKPHAMIIAPIEQFVSWIDGIL